MLFASGVQGMREKKGEENACHCGALLGGEEEGKRKKEEEGKERDLCRHSERCRKKKRRQGRKGGPERKNEKRKTEGTP